MKPTFDCQAGIRRKNSFHAVVSAEPEWERARCPDPKTALRLSDSSSQTIPFKAAIGKPESGLS